MPVLLVVSHPQLRTLIRKIPLRHGFSLVERGDGADALATLQRLGGVVALVITDYELSAMDGITLARHVKKQFPSMPVLLMSSGVSQADCTDADGLLRKPFKPAELITPVRSLLEARTQ